MDDVSFQWIGSLAKYAGVVFNAVTAFAGYTRQLGFLLQASKSGYLASSTEAARAVKSRAARLKLQAFRTARYLGHDTFAGGTAHRALERKRLGAVLGRRGRLRALRRAGGLRSGCCGARGFCRRVAMGLVL